MLTDAQKKQIEIDAQDEVQAEIKAAFAKQAKKANKGKGKKSGGRTVSIDRDLVNTFNARVALKGISKQLRGNITAATIDIEGIVISMTRLPKKNDWDKVRYEVTGGHGKDLIAMKQEAIFCLSARAVIETNKLQGIEV